MENTSIEDKNSSQRYSIIFTFCAISFLFIYLVYSGNFVFGSDIGEWTFSYKQAVVDIPKWILLASLLLIGIFIYLGSKLIQKYEKMTLVGCLVLAIAIQIIIQNMVQNPLGDVVKSDVANSFYTTALKYTPTEILSQYQTLVPSLPGHARSNMPGKILFFQFLTIFTKNPQIMGLLIISISSIGGLLLYGICKRLFCDKTIGLYAFVLFTLIPCKQDFFPILNTVTPVFILICLYLFVTYLDNKKKILLVLLGITLYLLVLFEPSPLVVGIVFVGILFNAIVQKKVSFVELLEISLFIIVSFLATYLLLLVIFSFDIFQALSYVLKDAAVFNSSAGRAYSIWLRENVKEFFYGAGLPVMMIFVFLSFNLLGQWKNLIKNPSHWSMESTYIFSLLITFAIVLFLGLNRGEVTRLWIYMSVFFQIPASYFLAKIVKSNTVFFILAATLLVQTLVTLQRIVFIEI